MKYALDEQKTLYLESVHLSHGDDPCHLTRHQEDLITCNYSSGGFSIYAIKDLNQVAQVKQKINHSGRSIHERRQESPHVHFAGSTPNQAFIAVVDLGIDRVLFYEKQQEQYVLHSQIICEPGSGPRHLVFHPTLPLIYIVNELASTVVVYEHCGLYRQFKSVQVISTLPDSFTENNQCAAIVMSQDHRNLYISNRGHDSISTYKIDDSTGHLTFIDIIHAAGKWPRDCALTPSQEYLFVANEHSNSVCIFKRNNPGGSLNYISEILVSQPTCIVFIE